MEMAASGRHATGRYAKMKKSADNPEGHPRDPVDSSAGGCGE